MKLCSKCQTKKSLNCFSLNKKGKQGRNEYCKKCTRDYYDKNREKLLAYAAKYYRDNLDKITEYAKKYREEHPDYNKNYWKGYYQKHKIRYSDSHLYYKWSLTKEQFLKILEEQGYGCLLCGFPFGEGGKRLSIDHDHSCCPTAQKTCGKCIRGFIHQNCNILIGLADENPEICRKAAIYLEKICKKSV